MGLALVAPVQVEDARTRQIMLPWTPSSSSSCNGIGTCG
jgi:hypothetical protein